MSAVEDNRSRYMAIDHQVGGCVRYQVVEMPCYKVADCFRNYKSAVHAASLLNTGDAIVDHHATLGCRVQPSRVSL